jgi:hypothetical protein
MQLDEWKFGCNWCGKRFVRPHERGRRPLYCTRTCRQRAYEERRRGAFVVGLPKPILIERLRPVAAHYQAGIGGPYLNVAHALRPDGAPDYIGFRPTLCGAYVKPSIRPFYEDHPLSGRPNCATCASVARRHPAARLIDPPVDIGTATALIGGLRAARRAPAPVLRAQVDEILAHLGTPGGAALRPWAAPPGPTPGATAARRPCPR